MESTQCRVVTASFRIGRGRMVRFLLMRHALWWLVGISGIALGLIVAGVMIDLRLCVLGLIAVCLCLPMAVAMVMIAHGLAPANALNTLQHRVVITAEGVTVEVLCPAEEASENDESVEKSVSIDVARLDAYAVIDGAIAIPVRSVGNGMLKSDGVLILPYTAFESTEQFRSAVAMLPKRTGAPSAATDGESVTR